MLLPYAVDQDGDLVERAGGSAVVLRGIDRCRWRRWRSPVATSALPSWDRTRPAGCRTWHPGRPNARDGRRGARWRGTCGVAGRRLVCMVVPTRQRAARPPAESEKSPMDAVARKECWVPALTSAGTRVRLRPGSRWPVRRITSLHLSCYSSPPVLFRMRNAPTGRGPAERGSIQGHSKATVVTAARRNARARTRPRRAARTLADQLKAIHRPPAKLVAPCSPPPTTAGSYPILLRPCQ